MIGGFFLGNRYVTTSKLPLALEWNIDHFDSKVHYNYYRIIWASVEFRKKLNLNPLVPSTHKSGRIAKSGRIVDPIKLELEGTIKKFPMRVATMSR